MTARFAPASIETLDPRRLLSAALSGSQLIVSGTADAYHVLIRVDNADTSKLLVNVNGLLYFTAWDAAHGTELWRSDGTSAGTMMVKDIYPGTAGSLVERAAARPQAPERRARRGARGPRPTACRCQACGRSPARLVRR